MKLKDILARELKAWPTDVIHDHCVQSDETTRVYFGGPHAEIFLSERADETVGVKVTRAEWQAAVEALKAEQAAELKWPDGAEFMGTTKEGDPKVFYRNVGGDYEYRYERDTCWSKNTGNPSHVPLIPRPTERAVEWDGDGEPPVGTECEWHPNVHGWVKVKILGRDGADTWYRAAGEEHSQTCRNMAFFRPILTKEQIAAEERMADAYAMCAIAPSLSNVDAIALYDAFYRKQVAE